MPGKNSKTKIAIFSAAVLFAATVFVLGGNVKPAQAILGVGDVSVTVGDVPRMITDLIGRIRTRYGSLAFQRAIRAVSYKLAQDTAVFIGNGGKGKKPLIFEDFGSWAKGAADEVAGKYIVNLTAGFPVDVCSPSSIKSQLAITLGISKSLSQIKIGEALLGYCPPGTVQSTPAQPGQSAKARIALDARPISDVDPVVSQIIVNGTNILSQPVAWPSGYPPGTFANAIAGSINANNSSNFVASSSTPDPKVLRSGVDISSRRMGTQFNNAELRVESTIVNIEGATFSGGVDPVAASTGIANCVANVNRDIGRQGCSFSKIRENFAEAAKAKNFLADVQTGFESGKNDLIIASTLSADAKRKLEEEKQAQTIARLQTGGDIKGVVDPITGQTRTPSEQVKQAQGDAQAKASKEPPRTEDIFTDTLAVFTNTLAQTYLKRLQSGYYPFRSTKRASGPDSELAGSAGSNEALIASFAIFSPERALDLGTAGEVDLFSEITTCPPPALQAPYNCLLNNGLQQAIQQGLSVAQAVQAKFIDPNLLFPEEPDPNQPKLSADNLAKLRFLRVLPVGWELAADVLNKNGKKVPMSALLGCFENQTAGEACNVDSAAGNDLYHLVDPDWILALPKQFCRAQGYTGIPENEKSPNRQQICVDLQSCLQQDSSGKCQSYGYCTRERAVWQLQGQTCDAHYATCHSLRRPDGSVLSILGSDVNAAGCTQMNAGCSWYSRPTPASTDWSADQRIYLTNQAPSCSAADAGSREIIPLEPGVNLLYSARGGPVKIKPYTYYTISFAPDADRASGVRVAAAGASNVSFPDSALSLTVPAVALSQSRYAATFFSGPARTATVTVAGDITDLQLEEVGLAAGREALDVIRVTKTTYPTAGIETFNALSSGTINQASPATAYHPYANNRRLVFAGAATCQPEEASARAYTPLSGNNAAKVARLTAAGLCPRECSGLDTYLAMSTPLEELAANSALSPASVSFIPSYGRACSAAEVGCEEFTNLAPQASEQKEYYSRVESCILDANPNAATFYTWAGTDTAGFQLKAWQLLKDGSGGPCGAFAAGREADPAAASCPANLPRRACAPSADDPNCSVWLDTAGVEYTRDIRQVVTASAQCQGFRRTLDNQTWYFVPGEANRCSPQAALCRQYKGGQANLTRTALASDFESGPGGWDHGAPGTSYVVGGGAYRISSGEGSDISHIFSEADGSFLGKTFILDFDAKGDSGESALDLARLNDHGHDYEFAAPAAPLRLATEWRHYTLGPVYYESLPDVTGLGPTLMFRARDGAALLDNIKLTEVQDNLYLITDSWKNRQPAACTAGAGAERFGRCAPYSDTANNTYYVSQFAALFRPEAQFCRAVIDTQNSDAPEPQIFNNENSSSLDDITVPADDLGYFILQPGNLRLPQAAGCTAVGKPDNPAAPAAWETNYRLIDPDYFGNGALCRVEGLGCQSFQAADGVASFNFRDPGANLCGYNSATKTFTRLDAAGNLTAAACPAGWVRQCPAREDSCAAYVPSEPGQGEGSTAAIFALANTVETGNCAAGSQLKDGCLSFTQAYSDAVKVAPDNLLPASTRALTVKSSRQCAEWLAPLTTSIGTDPKSNASRTVVYDLGRCQELGPDGRCLGWADSADLANDLRPYPGAYITGGAVGKFNLSQYQARRAGGETLFSGAWDYAGYSIPGQYPLELLREDAAGNLTAGAEPAGSLSCRSYPEDDAPFSSAKIRYTADADGNFKPSYTAGTRQLEALNKCAPDEAGSGNNNCDCSYKKAAAATGETQYYGQRSTQTMPADTQSVSLQDGWYGYCVAYDKSTLDPNGNPVCLTWWPVDAVAAKPNVFDNHPEAGFSATAPQYYCLAAKGNKLDNPEFGIKSVKASGGADLVKNNNYFIEVPWVWNQKADKDFRVNIAPFAVNVGGSMQGSFLSWENVWGAIKINLSFLVPYYGWFDALDKVRDAAQTAIEDDGVLVFPFNFIGYQNKDHNRIVRFAHGCAIHPSSGGCISENPVRDDGTANPNYLEGGKPDYRSGEYGLDSNGWSEESGLLTFPVNNNPPTGIPASPLATLHDYDIEKIILKPLDHQYSDWPKSNTEIILQRGGWAQQAAGGNAMAADTDDRWTAYWCTGESCDFGDKFHWDTIVNYLKNEKIDGIALESGEGKDDQEDRNGLCATLKDGTNLLAVRAVFADSEGNIPEGYEDFRQGIAGMNTGLHSHSYVKNFGFSGSRREPYSFLGLQGGICDKSGSQGWVPLRMIIQLREWCTTVAAVTDISTGESRAWTGRVNNQSTVSYPNDGSIYNANAAPEKLVGLYSRDFTFNQDSKPFGAIVPPTSTIYTPEKWDSRLDFTEEETVVAGKLVTTAKPLEPGQQPLYVEASQKQTRAGSPYACTEAAGRCIIPPIKDAPQTSWFVDSISSLGSLIAYPFDYLKQIFAKVYKIWSWDASQGGYLPRDLTGADLDLTEDVGECPILQAVQVVNGAYAPITGDQNSPSSCSAGKYSINGKTASNLNGNPVTVDAGVEVSLDFYAYNDNGEQLPLRAIEIDWDGDAANNEPLTIIKGDFKNHRPACDGSDFGRSDQACEANIFQFKHVYQSVGQKRIKLTITDNWGRAANSSYSYAVVSVNQPLLNLPPVALLRSPADRAPANSAIDFSWTPPPAFTITDYRLELNKKFSDGRPETAETSRSVSPSLRVAADPALQSVTLSVRACLRQGCGREAADSVYFAPGAAGPVSFFPSQPAYGGEVALEWEAAPLATLYELEIIKNGGPPVKIDTAARRRAIVYEPNLQSLSARVQACNGPICGQYSSSRAITYQEGVLITGGIGSFRAAAGRAWSTVIMSNKSDITYSVSADKPSWLAYYPDPDSGSRLIITGTPPAGATRTQPYDFIITASHAGTSTRAEGTISLTVVNLCGNGTVETDVGEQCEPGQFGGDATRCTAACLWAGDLDTDGVAGQTDCNNNPASALARNTYPGSPYTSATSGDYNCDGRAEEVTECVGADGYAVANICSGENSVSQSQADAWCRNWRGQPATAFNRCNTANEIRCRWCASYRSLGYH